VKVSWSNRALRDLYDIYEYILPDGEERALRVIQRIVGAMALLSANPHMGRASRLHGRRELVVGQHVVTYSVRSSTVSILTVEHGKQRK
jgi:toxin ParE1/3/4